MGVIRDILNRAKERRRKEREGEENERIFGNIQEKKLSHYEREMIKILQKEKEQNIREALYWEEKRRQAEEKWRARQMMKFNPEFFNDDIILTQKKLFLGGH
ncbi:MAG: hypothetical protein JSW08_00095 [archaeon]|nr:MAG: hypothetical protein JSW08_00095 [archaeon]